ncbi:MAG: LysE family translocator [Pseudomonadota bacterium]
MLATAIALVVFLFPLAYSPGPGNMFFAANGARFGTRATLPANAGYHVATWVVTLAIGLGAAEALERSPLLFTVMKWGGAAYVLYLAWTLFRAGAIDGEIEAKPASFAGGVLLLLVNPKAYLIIALIFTQFLRHDGSDDLVTIVWIATIFTLNNLIAFLVWTIIGAQLARSFRDEAYARRMNMAFGTILAGVAVWMAVT